MSISRRFLSIMVATAIFLSLTSVAITFDISTGQSIQEALNAAGPGDILAVRGGSYHESLNITKPVILAGSNHPLLDSGAIGSAITLRADGITVQGFDIRSTRQTGIRVLSSKNILVNNTISGCLDGLRVDYSRGNFIAFNDINNNTNGVTLYASSGNTIRNNNIRDNNINEESDCGIFLIHSQDNLILGNELMENGDTSISLRSCRNNTLQGNNVSHNDWYGISLSEASNGNLLLENHADSNRDAGIYLDSSRGNVLRGNTASDNSRGIYLSFDSNDNLLEKNSVSGNDKGFHLANHAGNNTLWGNTAKNNGYGIYLSFSSGWNLIFQNRLIDNGCNAYDMAKTNRWDNGSIGNYYSDLGKVFYVPGGSGVDRHPMS
ncbi:Periplasmic copper-binding protein (NosD) [uncultured archaeon]|nr:Periplasmic copper-binding protein (NosD) [uncultured archaeon]